MNSRGSCKPIRLTFLVSLLWSLLMLPSCVKEPLPPPQENVNHLTATKALYVLNEGLFNMNNSSLSYISLDDDEAVKDYFYAQNGRKLGDTGNDMARYGSKLYIVVSVSSQLEVLDAASGKSLKQIPFFDDSKARQPRAIAFHGSKAFVCSFDGTVAVIDTASLAVERYIAVGKNPDGIAVSNGKVYVSNSGGLDYPNYDSTVSVIDVNTYQEIKKITMGLNPHALVPDQYGNLFVITRGNYDDVPMSLKLIDSHTDEVVHVWNDKEVLNLTVQGDTAYLYHHDYTGGTGSSISLLHVVTRQIIREGFVTDGTLLETVYGIAVDPASREVWVADSKDFGSQGRVHRFSSDGKRISTYEVGMNPSKMVFMEKAISEK